MEKKAKWLLFILPLMLFSMILFSTAVEAGLSPPLPKVFIPAPPDVVLIPGAYAYFVPDIDADIVFYEGRWYRLHDGRWHSAIGYNGPWVIIVVNRVPAVLLNLPPGFRRTPPGHTRIPHGQLKKNWKRWQADKHWDKQERKAARKERKMERRHEREDKGRGPGHEGGGRGRGR